MAEDLPPTTAAAIAGNVALVQDKVLGAEGIAPDDWLNAVAYLSDYIEQQRLRPEAANRKRLEDVLASYLGEAIVQLHSGRWVQSEHGIGVEVAGILTFPFAKTSKNFENGSDDNILGFLRGIEALKARAEGGDKDV